MTPPPPKKNKDNSQKEYLKYILIKYIPYLFLNFRPIKLCAYDITFGL